MKMRRKGGMKVKNMIMMIGTRKTWHEENKVMTKKGKR